MRFTDDDVQALARHVWSCPACQADAPCATKPQLLAPLVQRLADQIDAAGYDAYRRAWADGQAPAEPLAEEKPDDYAGPWLLHHLTPRRVPR